MHEADGHRPLADGRGDPLDRAGADVARRRRRRAGWSRAAAAARRRARRGMPTASGPGEHEAVRVERELRRPASRVRLGADEDEQRPGLERRAARRCGCPRRRRASSALVAEQLATSVCEQDLDVGRRARSGRPGSATCSRRGRRRGPAGATCDACAARNTAAWPAELPPPTTTTGSPAQSCASISGRGVVDAVALELLEPRHVELAVARAGGDDHGARARPAVPSSSLTHVVAVVALERRPPRPGRRCRAPNFSAWMTARSASSAPEMPGGKPR